jgi:hypothetical protein
MTSELTPKMLFGSFLVPLFFFAPLSLMHDLLVEIATIIPISVTTTATTTCRCPESRKDKGDNRDR